jgi:hypothetical protein
MSARTPRAPRLPMGIAATQLTAAASLAEEPCAASPNPLECNLDKIARLKQKLLEWVRKTN